MRKIMLSLVALLFAAVSFAQNPDWSRQLGDVLKKIDWLKQSDYGYLICGADNIIYCVNNVDGNVVWVNKELPLGISTESSSFIDGTPYMLIEYTSLTGKGRAAIINVLNGKIIYNSKEDGVKVAEVHKLLKADGILLETIKSKEQIITFLDIISGQVKWSVTLGTEKGGIGLGAIMRKMGSVSYLGGKPFVNTSGDVILSYKKELMALNKETGAASWKVEMPKEITNYISSADGQLVFVGAEKRFDVIKSSDGKSFLSKPIKLEGEFNDIMAYNNDYIVMHTSGFNIWDVNKMAFRFEKEKDLGNISQITICPNGFAALQIGKKESVISLIDFTGKRLWNEKLDDDVLSMYATSKGVWYVTEARSNVLSFEKGKDLWKRDVKLKGIPSVAVDPANNHVLIYANKVLYRFDINEVNMAVLTEDASLKDFDEEKFAAKLEVRKDGYVITTAQNICFVEKDGKIRYNNHFREVGLSKAARFGLKALSVGAGVYSAGSSVGDFLSDPGKFRATNGVVDLNDEYNQSQLSFKSRASGDIATGMFDIASKRYAASKETKDHAYILTKFEDGTKGLVKVRKSDGKEAQRFIFKDKEPEYVVDELDGKIFLVENDKFILRYTSDKN